MPDSQCNEAMQLLNAVFASGLILNDGHEILARLEAGDELISIATDLNDKFGQPGGANGIRRIIGAWPPLHLQAMSTLVQWALGKLDTEDRVRIAWKGDAEHPETVTRFELRGHDLLIEFAHPPGSLVAPSNG